MPLSKFGKRCSYETWEYLYFAHILKLYEIFSVGMKKLYPSLDLWCYDFLDVFGKFIYDYSSKELSMYENELSDNIKDLYMTKRYKCSYKNGSQKKT